MNMKMKRLILSVLLSAIASSSIWAGQGRDSNNLKAKSIDSLYARYEGAKMEGGFAFAVIDNGQVIFKKGFGFADVENSIPFTTSTICDYASISKQFTGFAVAELMTEGALSADDDIRKYLPELPDYGVKVTIRHLLGHTSGLRDFVPLLKLSGRQDGDVVTDEFLMKLIAGQKELNFNPGDRHLYSNSGYFLLAHIVSRVTGVPFADWMRKNVFHPLGMESTRYLNDPGEIITNRARSYSQNSAGLYRSTPDNLSAIGSSSLFSSLDDMVKWVMNLMTREVGRKESFDKMTAPTTLNHGEIIAYNFGLETGQRNGRSYLRHGGSWGGFLSDIICFPEEKAAVILITNRDPLDVLITNAVLEVLFGVTPKNEKGPEGLMNEGKPKIAVKKEILDRYVGDYVCRVDGRNTLYQFASVKLIPENFVFHTSWARNNRLFAETERTFFSVGVDNRYEFVCDENGRSTKVIANLEGKEYVFARIDPFIRDEENAAKLLGEYYSDELQISYFLGIINHQLVFQSLLNEDVLLSLVEPGTYVTNQYWFREVVFVKDAAGQIEGFRLQTDNGNISKNIRFRKRNG